MDESLRDGLLGAFMILMSVVTTIGNILVILVILVNKKLRTKENAFILSLAASDLLVGVFVMPMATVKDLLESWWLGETLCHFWQVVDLTCTTSSIFSICAVTVVRYIRIKKPYRYSNIMTKKVVVWSLAFIWVVPTIATLFRYFFMFCKKKSRENDENHKCVIVESYSSSAVSSVLIYFIPCLVMVCIYSCLFACSRRHLNHITENNPYQRAWNNYKTAVTIGVIMGAFLLCWIPFHVALLVDSIFIDVSDNWFTIFIWFGYSNSMLDPIVYSLMNKEFRKPFKVSFRRFFQPTTA